MNNRLNLFSTKNTWSLLAGVAALLLLALLIGTSPAKLVYDEKYHMNLVQNVIADGWLQALTSPHNQSAAGPLYPMVQIAAMPLTGFRVPAIRWVNLICLIIVIFIVAKTYHGDSLCPPWVVAVSILSVPYLWPTAGMALTELPALAAFTLFVFALLQVLRLPDDHEWGWSFGWAGVAGIALGVSILGRQTYLVILPAVATLFITAPKKWMSWLICLVIAVGCCSWLFILWHGLVPASQRALDSYLRLDFGVQSLSYVAAATLFLSPQWLKISNVRVALVSVFLGVGLTLITRDYVNPPAKTLLLKIFGDEWGFRVGFCIAALLTIISVVWVCNTLIRAWRERHDPASLFLFMTLIALVAAPMKVSHQFSSRYVVGLLGVLVLLAARQASGYVQALRIALGSLAGAATLLTYYHYS